LKAFHFVVDYHDTGPLVLTSPTAERPTDWQEGRPQVAMQRKFAALSSLLIFRVYYDL